MKTKILFIVCLFVNCLNFQNSTQIVDNQTDIANKISNGEEIDLDLAIGSLKDQALMNVASSVNPLNIGNIGVRNRVLLSILYYLKSDRENYLNYLDTAKALIRHNLINDSIWSEGPSYYLYVVEMIDVYTKVVGSDDFFKEFKEKCDRWRDRYIMPDGTLAPIGDTRLNKGEYEFDNTDRIVFDNEETLIKKGVFTIFIRHPQNIDKYKINGHISYDIGDFVLYKEKECLLLPVGYPGNELKSKYNLGDLNYKNSIYVEKLGCWRLKNYEVLDIERTDSSVF